METYHGHVRTPADAIVLFEACRLGLLPRVQRRLSEKERQNIKSGSVFVWDEREAGMRRWTDGKSWSASRVSGSFLTYREMEGKRGGNNAFAPPVTALSVGRGGKSPNPDGSDSDGMDPDGPDGYRYKPDGLMKQSFSITTATHQKLHLISYYARSHPTSPNLIQPTNDTALKHIRPVKGMYPESTVHEQQNVPVVTRTPMISAMPPNYGQRNGGQFAAPAQSPGPYAAWPPSPVATPPTSVQVMPQYAQHPLPASSNSAAASPMTYTASYTPQMPLSNGGSPRMYHDRPALPQLDGLPSVQGHRGSMGGSMGGSPMLMHRSPRSVSVQPQMQQRPSPPLSLPAPQGMPQQQAYDAAYSSPANSIHSRSPPRSSGGQDQPQWDITPLRDSPSSAMDVDRSLDVQDIPNEKLHFREDIRALRVLDKAFVL